MSRRRRNPRCTASGVLLVDKPAGPTSHDVVEGLRRRFQPGKVGHAGTLDPFATGLLVLAFNQATRLLDLLGSGQKLYRATLVLGQATDTGDPTGQVIATSPVPELEPALVAAALKGLEGSRMQAPPAFSAAKHLGRPLYSYARAGIEVQKPPRPITVYQARLLGIDRGLVDFDVRCSRGTYLRTLAQELAQALGGVGHLESLRRQESAPFGVDDALPLDLALDLEQARLEEALLPLDQALDRCGLPALVLDEDLAWQLRQGRILPRDTLDPAGQTRPDEGGAFRVLDQDGELAAVLRWLTPEQRRPGRDYETIRVFSGQAGRGGEASASALGAE